MALQHLRSSTADKRPTPGAMSDGQLAINTNAASTGLFFKDSAGALVKVGPVHVGTTAPNATPAVGGQSGNTVGEQWLDTSGGTYVFKVWDGSAWRSEAGEFVNSTGDTMTGDLTLDNANIVFEGSTADTFETTLTVADPTADNTITLPNVSGTVVTTGDTGSVTSTMIADGTIVDADVNSSAAIAHSKLASMTAGNILLGNSSDVPTSTAVTGDVTINNVGVTAISAGAIVNADISASAEIAVSKLQDGSARQLLQTDAAGTGVEWTSNVDVPGTLDVTGAATFDSTASVTGDLAVNANTLFVDVSANAVGIGTTSPQSELVVRGSTPQITLEPTSDAQTCRLQFALTDGTIQSSIHSGGSLGTNIVFIDGPTFAERARIDSSGRLLVGTSSDSGGALLQVNGNRIRVATAKTPASASDTGTTGEICWDASYIYVCTATNTWKRAALSTW